jgi:hypothetical protein
MPNPMPRASIDQAIDSLIELAGCSIEHRILLAGTTVRNRIPDWRSRGYHRVATMATSRLPRGQYDAAFVEWRQHSIKALETMLDAARADLPFQPAGSTSACRSWPREDRPIVHGAGMVRVAKSPRGS